MLRLIAALVVVVVSLAPAFAFEGENLLVSMPQGYKVGFKKTQGKATITELVPQGETVEAWTEMVTVQVFNGLKAKPEEFRDRITSLWAKSCAGAESAPIVSAPENGYPMTMWLSSCPLNKETGKPEFTFMKAMAGQDSFYVVQKAFKATPTRQECLGLRYAPAGQSLPGGNQVACRVTPSSAGSIWRASV